jgi:hypothetical protein
MNFRYKKLGVFLMGILLATLSHNIHASAEAYIIAENGKSDYVVIKADKASPAEELASEELCFHLSRITGNEFKAVKESEIKNTVKGIYVGWTQYAKSQEIYPEKLSSEEWIIKTVDRNIVITGGRTRGTLYGVYEFLEKYCGCAWLDEETEVVPSIKTLAFSILSEHGKPMFARRNIYWGAYFKTEQGKRFYVGNKLNTAPVLNEARYGFIERYGSPSDGHTLFEYSKDWRDSHPEFFSLDANGKRLVATSAVGPGQLCLSNPEVRKLVLEKLKHYIKTDRTTAAKRGSAPPAIYNLSLNDGGAKCLCLGCKDLYRKYETYSGALLDFVNEIARGIKPEYPDVLIETLAYNVTMEPPKNIKAENNVIISICNFFSGTHVPESLKSVQAPENQLFLNRFKAWSEICRQMRVWDYWVFYIKLFETPYIKSITNIQSDLKYYANNNVTSLFIESENYGSFFALRRWIGLKLLQNPDNAVEPMLKTFMDGYYGKASEWMQKYLGYLEKRIADNKNSMGKLQPYFHEYLDINFFTTVNELLENAEKSVKDNPSDLRHVRDERPLVDCALLHLWDRLEATLPKDNKMPFKREEIMKRYEQYKLNSLERVRSSASLWYGSPANQPPAWLKLTEITKKLNLEMKLFNSTQKASVPEQFKGMNVVEISWWDFKANPRYFGTEIVEDNSSENGMALRLGSKSPSCRTEKNIKEFHLRPISMIIYDTQTLKSSPGITLKDTKIPQDSRYHWYKVGSFNISPGVQLCIHWSWSIHPALDAAYEPCSMDNMRDVYVSLKLTGPAYVKGATDENSIFVNRILLVKTPKNK